MLRRLLFVAAAFSIEFAPALPAHAQEYPVRPIKIVVPYPAGGTADLMPRIFAERLAAKWGQPVLVEDHPGAGGNIAAEIVYKAEPDGYTLLASPPGPLIINQNLYRSLAFDPAQFVPVAIMGAVPNVLLVTPGLEAKSVQELIAYAKAHPGKLNYASQGSGTTSHLTAELFKSMAGGLAITHIPYKGSAPALADLLSGQVDLMFDNLGVSLQHVKSGKLRALAVGGEKRIASLPDVPAMAEILPGFSSVTWFGIVAPPKTPMPVAERLSAAIADAIGMPEVRERLAKLSAEPIGGTPAEMAAFMKQDSKRWREVIRAAGVKAD